LKKIFPLEFLLEIKKKGNVVFVKNNQTISIKDIEVKVIGFQGDNSETYGFLFTKNNKKVLYIPCDTISFQRANEFKNLDLLIHECGIFSHDLVKCEISFPDLIKRIELMNPRKTILTHIEESELRRWGLAHLEKLQKTYPKNPFTYAHNGMKIKV
jgi:ribonuclease BN (tRNA processing enzyme)